MKIYVDELPSAYYDCPFYSYEHAACIAYGGQYECPHDKDTGRLTEECDWLVEMPKGDKGE